jgi:hypothetical protein
MLLSNWSIDPFFHMQLYSSRVQMKSVTHGSYVAMASTSAAVSASRPTCCSAAVLAQGLPAVLLTDSFLLQSCPAAAQHVRACPFRAAT